jgi:hypothetical protein
MKGHHRVTAVPVFLIAVRVELRLQDYPRYIKQMPNIQEPAM